MSERSGSQAASHLRGALDGGGTATTAVRLLLADDHRMLREGLRRSLESAGLVVVAEAADGGTWS
jgi:hypothetical protein